MGTRLLHPRGKEMTGVGHLSQAWHAVTSSGLAAEDVPLLARGRHANPHHGASLVELVAVYAHEPWSLYPPCVNRALATAAQAVNDETSDQSRRQLIPLVPFLAETGAWDPKVSYDVATVCMRAAPPLANQKARQLFSSVEADASAWRAADSSGPHHFALHHPAYLHRLDVAIRTAVAAVAAAETEPAARDASLRHLLIAATTVARRARGLSDAAPAISLREPEHISVIRHWITEPGCDWLTLVCVPAGDVEHARVFGVSAAQVSPA
jgi:hypothetical protein